MIFLDLNIEVIASDYLSNLFGKENELIVVNSILFKTCGVKSFFSSEQEIRDLKKKLEGRSNIVCEPSRREYGDFQTNSELAEKIISRISSKNPNPSILFEPTCGKGAFIIAAIKGIDSLKKIIGLEIYLPYVWGTKFKILAIHLNGTAKSKPIVEIVHADVFDFSFEKIKKEIKGKKILVIGNPPWVTNSELGALNSSNLPHKSNFKKHSGIDAITGKGNFDIGKYISLALLRQFENVDGCFAFLVKNAVVKNIVFIQNKLALRIGGFECMNIDAKKEFNVSVGASLFYVKLNTDTGYVCRECDFYSNIQKTQFGWYNDKFVYSIENYKKAKDIDGVGQSVWRQGVKHDCSKIMELKKDNGHFLNGFNEQVELEKELLYGLLKSSDLKAKMVSGYRKSTIITQKKNRTRDWIY